MSQPPKPHVKLPDVMPQKHIVPGPNSWALSATQGDPKKLPQPAQSTNREKYEQNPMPRTPGKALNDGKLAVSKHRVYIQPATPLGCLNQSSHNQKSRAATDPVKPQPLFTGKPGGIAHIRQKFSTSKSNVNIIKEDDVAQTSSPNVFSEKASQILGAWPVRDNSRRTPPASAPPSTSTPDPYRISSDDHTARSTSPARNIQSTPVPTPRFLKENKMTTPEVGRASLTTTAETGEAEGVDMDISENPEGMTSGDEMSHPTRTGTYGGVGGVEYVNEHENQRIASYAGIIENAEFIDQTSPTMVSNTSQEHDSGGLLQPTVYSPSNYDGVWENDPHVGYTLPPFTPLRPQHAPAPELQMRGSSQDSGTTVPVVLRDYYQPPSRLSMYPPSTASVNSWAQNSHFSLGNSFAASNHPSPAGMRSQFPNHNMSNAAPTPPRSHPEFQPSGPMPAGLAHLELTLHHHIESCFGSLSRLVADKHDRVMDQTIRRLENLEETVTKGQKNGKGDVKDMKKEFSNLKAEVRNLTKGNDEIKDLIKALDQKIGKLEKSVEASGLKGRPVATDTIGHEAETSRVQKGDIVHRRTESAHNGGNSERPQQNPSGANHSASARHQSGNSSKGRRSNTTSGGGAGSAAGSSRREYFTELGASRGPVPDVREHPAYSGVQQGYELAYDSNGMPVGLGVSDTTIFQAPSFSEGWYQRVYGP